MDRLPGRPTTITIDQAADALRRVVEAAQRGDISADHAEGMRTAVALVAVSLGIPLERVQLRAYLNTQDPQ